MLLLVRLERSRSRGSTKLLLIELILEWCKIHIALVELAIKFCRLRHIRRATRVVAATVGETTKPRFHMATFDSNWLLNVAIYTLLYLSLRLNFGDCGTSEEGQGYSPVRLERAQSRSSTGLLFI